MSPLLRRLGVTRRRSVVRELEHALEVAETDRDIARAEKASAYEALGKVAAAAGRPGAPVRWNVEDLVQWVAAAGKVEDQRDTLGAELVAVDEALAELAAGPSDDRAVAIRNLTRGTDRDPSRPSAGVFVVGQAWLTAVLAAAQHTSDESLSPDDVLILVRGLEQRRVDAVREGDRIAVNLSRAREDTRRAEGHAKRNADRLRQLPRDVEHIAQWCRAIGVKATRQPQLLSDAEALAATAPRIAEELARALTGEPLEYAGPPVVEVEAADPWCSADLDGSPCVRPVGHTEPCSAGPAVSGNMFIAPWPPVAQCRATGEPVAGRCELVAGHPGDHEWAAV